MREIKFRAWDTSRKLMFSALEMGQDELQLNPDGRGFFNASSISPKLSQYYPHMVPLQYTGLEDKNGKEIYEGDIVRPGDADKNQVLREVYWDNLVHQFRLSSRNGDKQFDKTMMLDFARIGEVIGNIYENPELLIRESD